MKIRMRRFAERGDTVVEVMVSMTVLAVVVAAAYAISTRSFQTSLNAQDRDQAVSYAQQQVELIKEADNGQPSTISVYTADPGAQFCVDPSTLAKQTVSSGNCLVDSLYTLAVTYNISSKTFRVTTSWTSIDNNPQQTVLFYKASDSFAGSTVACTTASDSCVSTVTSEPDTSVNISFASDDPSVNYKGSTTLRWSASNATKCWKDGGAWGADASTNIGTSGSYATGSLTSSQNYTIGCQGPSGQASSSTTVTVAAPPTPILQTLTPIVYGDGNVYFRGNINPNGYTTTAWYQWGINSDLSGCALTTSAFGEPAVNYTITDTRFGSYWGNGTAVNYYNCNSHTYYYRVCAYSTFDTSLTVCGNIVLFGMQPPAVTTGGATQDVKPGVSNSSGWTFGGTINPNGNNVDSCYFQYDNDTDLNNGSVTAPCASGPGGGTSPVGVSAHVDLDDHYRGEDSSATFYYRLCAYTSVGLGTTCGSVQNFRTR